MVPDKFNMVDMEGIDIITSQGEEISGLYQKLVESIAQCRYQCVYNWKFDGILIPPTYVEMTIIDDVVWINEGVSVDEEDVIRIYSLEPPAPEPSILELSVTENGTYIAPEGYDGYNPVSVDVPSYTPVIESLSVTSNGIYIPPSGVDGYNPVQVDVQGGYSQYLVNYFETISPKYSGGYEYAGYIYGTQYISDWGLVLLADASQQADSVVLQESISNFTGILLQGIYNKQRTSAYNTTIMYLSPQLNTNYWTGMKDRNQSYTCNVNFSDSTHATLSGNKQVIIYGIL